MPAHATHALRRVGSRRQALAPRSYAGAGTNVVLGVSAVALVALMAVPTFIVGPWIIKSFKPEWSYGRRLGASFAVSFAVSDPESWAHNGSANNVAIKHPRVSKKRASILNTP